MTMKSYDYSDMTRRAPTTPGCSPIGCCFRNPQSHYHHSIPPSNQRRGSAPRRRSPAALSQSYSPISAYFSRRASSPPGRRDEAPEGECVSLLRRRLMICLHEFPKCVSIYSAWLRSIRVVCLEKLCHYGDRFVKPL